MIRAQSDGMRRIADTESVWWWSEVLEPLFRGGIPASQIGMRTAGLAAETGQATDDALLALYHSHQTAAWMRNVFEGFESTLERTGLHARVERPPAICFFRV